VHHSAVPVSVTRGIYTITKYSCSSNNYSVHHSAVPVSVTHGIYTITNLFLVLGYFASSCNFISSESASDAVSLI